jgi:hypothetical protein
MWRVLRDIDRTGDVLVKICAADATPGDLDLNLSGRWFWRIGHILNPNILLAVPDRSFHALLHSAHESYLLWGATSVKTQMILSQETTAILTKQVRDTM